MAQAADPRPRVACVLNTWFPNSHADVFVSRLLDGYRLNGAWHAPRVRTVNFYVDQFPENDMAREQAAEYGIRVCSSVAEAVKDVDGIAVIGEHGQYPRSRLGNFQYPRKRYFDEITRVFAERRRPVPLFNDKYLAMSGPTREACTTASARRASHSFAAPLCPGPGAGRRWSFRRRRSSSN